MAYRARNGIVILNADTGAGWDIKTDGDIITALLMFPVFETVYTEYIIDALDRAAGLRTEYADIRDLARTLTENYI